MRILAIVVASLIAIAPRGVRADERETLQANGEQLAKDGRFGEAIDAFKAADRLQPRASHACLIALAYTRREAWSQAEIFLSICHQRATESDPLPDWAALADQQIKERLAAANVAAIEITVTPATTAAKVTVSSFAPDEIFEPRTIHLPFGTHVIFARADGFPEAQYTVEIKDKTKQQIVIDLAAKPKEGPKLAADRPSAVPWFVAGAGIGVAGGISHIWMAIERRKLVDAIKADNLGDYNDASPRYDVARVATIVLYAASATILVTAMIRRSNARKERAAVSAVPLEGGGGMVTVGWQR